MSFDHLRDRAKEEPVLANLPPLAEFYLPDLEIYPSVKSFERDLYDPRHQFESDVVVDTPERNFEYPTYEADLDSFGPELNNVVDWSDRKHYNRIKDELTCQSDIPDYISSNSGLSDAVILIVIDGLSFESLRPYTDRLPGSVNLMPVFVDGVSNTERGFHRVIRGNSIQSINARLNMQEFTDHLGFTYWDKDGGNELSYSLYKSMHKNKVHRIRDFEQTGEIIRHHGLKNPTYIQITRMGLDQESHNRKEEPDLEHEVRSIVSDVSNLFEVVNTLVDRPRMFVTSDHGILWRKDIEQERKIIDSDHSHPRYVEGPTKTAKGIEERISNEPPRTALAYPYMTRDFKHTEWGVHGGLSYQESIVPLVEITPE